ncbi:glycine cleavage system H protein [Sulfobacillus thermosulfidooxidans DSM 9293]|uniref:Glycine cleavage system H protein n=1 Tax=Sulfobacillus thermosulfidooxidans (strain DSM 9293 / VKM B-1269 / AT-1) TaxID=929705 RepID=A0A1W1WF79_SULTA|nr:glycine cleavage system protein GcvH [Sulfobacillus thermosulfidooxidans]SMC04926.1 glycine cleavage system H protein [Sulfobacillus thermosulfidooxidans DSM 9293]
MATEPIHRWKVLADRLYDARHQWVQKDDVLWTMGITDYTQDTAGDILYVSLPEPGTVLEQGQPFGSLESGKWVGQLYAPFDGVVIAANDLVRDNPQLLNQDPYGRGWLIKARAQNHDEAVTQLLTDTEYMQLLDELDER